MNEQFIISSELISEQYDTPFADSNREREAPENSLNFYDTLYTDLESPFTSFSGFNDEERSFSPVAREIYEFVGELNDYEFPESLYELVADMESQFEGYLFSNELKGARLNEAVHTKGVQYMAPLIERTETLLNEAAEHFSSNVFKTIDESEVERYFNELGQRDLGLRPAQEQFARRFLKKVKKAASKALKGVSKLMPLGILMRKLSRLVRPLLDRVLRLAINKLPENLRADAQKLADALMKRKTGNTSADTPKDTDNNTSGDSAQQSSSSPDSSEGNPVETPSTGSVEAVEKELDVKFASLVFAETESEIEEEMINYESGVYGNIMASEIQNEYGGVSESPADLNEALSTLASDLKNLREGESAQPAIEKFLPVAIMAAKPLIKTGIRIIGRKKVINFLANILSKLISKHLPESSAKPLARGIVSLGMGAIGFETYEAESPDVVYEIIANTVNDTIRNMEGISEQVVADQQQFMRSSLMAFERAAADNFPASSLRPSSRVTSAEGAWIPKPRGARIHLYKKFTHVFPVTITKEISDNIQTFRGLKLSQFLRDKLGLDTDKDIQARVHLYEGITGTRLSQISQYDNAPGLKGSFGYRQLHPLSVRAASLLFQRPGLGRNFGTQYTTSRYKTAVGQRFYYLEIPGANLKVIPRYSADRVGRSNETTESENPVPAVPNSNDLQVVLDLINAKIKLNYFISENDSIKLSEQLANSSWIEALNLFRISFTDALRRVMIFEIGSKVKILKEGSFANYVYEYEDLNESFIPVFLSSAAKAAGMKLLEGLVEKLGTLAMESITNFFKLKKDQFIAKQQLPLDGVTVKVVYHNVAGLAPISAWLGLMNRSLSVGHLTSLATMTLPIPNLPEILIEGGKTFE